MPYIPHPDIGYVHAEAYELERKLREGDGIFYSGDPRLELRVGVMVPTKGKYRGQIRGRRYEVWRHGEDGKDVRIGHWRLEEFDRILLDMAQMDVRTPGHESIIDRIEAGNDEHEKKLARDFRDAYGEMLEHGHKLIHDRNNPRTTFRGLPGLRDRQTAA